VSNLASITRDYGTYTELAFEYQTGFDGKRRWNKDHTTQGEHEYWYPCGVACCAGELLTLISTNGGDTWQTHRNFVRGATGTAFINNESQLSTFTATVLGYSSASSHLSLHDGFPVRRSGQSFGSSAQLYDDENDEMFVELRQASGAVTRAELDCWVARLEANQKVDKSYSSCQLACNLALTAAIVACGFLAFIPILVVQGVIAVIALSLICFDHCDRERDAGYKKSKQDYEDCIRNVRNPKPKIRLEIPSSTSGALPPPR
jgi:hypothetical protein